MGLLARREQKLRDLAEELGGGKNVAWATADVCDETSLIEALDQLKETLGGLDIVVANAGYAEPEPPRELRQGAAQKMYETNFFGALRMIDWAMPTFLEKGAGQIVGMSSMASYLGMPYSASYSGSKAALRIHLQSLRIALEGSGIAVTTLCPGFVKSALTENAEFPTPFILDTDKAAALIVDSIEKRKGEVAFPWQMRFTIGFVARVLPTRLAEKFLGFSSP